MSRTGNPAKLPHLSPGKRAVLAALVESQELSVIDLANAARVGRSSAAAALTFLEKHALAARRTLPASECKGRPSDVWYPTSSANRALSPEHTNKPDEIEAVATEPPAEVPYLPTGDNNVIAADGTPIAELDKAPEPVAVLAPTFDEAAFDEAAAERSDPPTTAPVSGVPSAGRLGKGVLRDAVRRHLLANPETAFTPTALSKALVKSSGAISNALDVLVAAGDAVLVREKPRTFQASSSVS